MLRLVYGKCPLGRLQCRSVTPVNFVSRESQNIEIRGKQNLLFPKGVRDQSLSDLLYSWKFWSWKFIKPRCNGGRRSTFAGNIELLPSDVVDFSQFCPLRDFIGKQFHCWMTCDLEVTNETARCWGEISSYITNEFINGSFAFRFTKSVIYLIT